MGRPRVAVLFGGRSSEHGVSCVTGGGVLGAIDRDRWDVVAIGITRDGRWTRVSDRPEDWRIVDGEMPSVAPSDAVVVPPFEAGVSEWREVADSGSVSSLGAIDVVFPLLHGPWGEDGTIQGALELADVRYVGSGVLASALGMDKQFMKIAFRAAGLPVADDVVVTPALGADEQREAIEALGLPVFVKPARAGSSMGISKVSSWEALDAALAEAVRHDPKVLIEAAQVGREIETAVLATPDGLLASPAGEIVTGGDHEFYDFEAKYLDEDAVQLLCPTFLEPDVANVVADFARRAFVAVGAEGLARVDVFVAPDGGVVVNEINTMPGFTTTSMYPRMAAAAGIAYPALVETLLATAMARPAGLLR
ncbi:D-alanine--D-alanine ligase family protein [Demequina lignilytica]|uniref:D-alanine--D-alanine ligase n=1 Tax=Demequina lignilytica TaxID=3051663 RepID=A0AB35MFF4_9MICO|nr:MULTISPECIES: D-alanine--D-alanine ligase family protein [unclassified Demequina]MDN4482495.1 D-alanine--D-alanine ligase family protein [Demequina sp. SYSU T0a273]MDN4489860.1 D-alanine--D-alanine ligase family protein [Demequina sp. SYSU T00068]